MRLFFAIRIPESIQSELVTIQNHFHGSSQKGNFTRKENLHLTLVFLGEVEMERYPDLMEVLNAIDQSPFEIEIDHLGSFEKRDGKILWLGFKANPDLFALHKQLTGLLRLKNFVFEDTPYKPHVTLARGLREKQGQSSHLPDIKLIRASVARVSLMVSERVDGLLQYREIEGINL